MPRLTVDGFGTFDVAEGMRLVNALEQVANVDQLHACGGFARCTTCRVQFIRGEPEFMTEAEKAVLTDRGLLATPGLRLSCQILCDHDMEVRPISRVSTSGRPDAGKAPGDHITPDPQWIRRREEPAAALESGPDGPPSG